jgi:hypothetical protein
MKLLLLTVLAYMANGALVCLAKSATNGDLATGANVVCLGTCASAIAFGTANGVTDSDGANKKRCAAGFFGTPVAAICKTPTEGTALSNAAKDGANVWSGCATACTAIANKASAATLTCTASTNSKLVGACDAGYYKVAGAAAANPDTCPACTTIANKASAATVTCDASTNSKLVGACDAGYYKVAGAAAANPDTCAACTTIGNKASAATVTCDASTNSKLVGACDDGYFKVAGAAAANPDTCSACTVAAPAATVTCTTGAAVGTKIATCVDTSAYTAEVLVAGAVTRACAASCATTMTDACKAKKAAVTAAAAKCTTCAGKQPGCTTAGTACGWANGPSILLKCSKAETGYSYLAGILTKCAVDGAKTYAAQNAAGQALAAAACKPASCNDGWTFATAGTCTINSCKKGAVPAAYTATGWPVVATADAKTKAAAIVKDDDACPAVVAVAAVPATILARATALLAKDAVKVAEYGTIGCKSPNVGTAKVECKVSGTDKAFTWSGCAPKASAATAQTMIGFVLTIIAMYL